MLLVRLDNLLMQFCTAALMRDIKAAHGSFTVGPKKIGLDVETIVFSHSRHLPGTTQVLAIAVEPRGGASALLDAVQCGLLAKKVLKAVQPHLSRGWRVHVSVLAPGRVVADELAICTGPDHVIVEEG